MSRPISLIFYQIELIDHLLLTSQSMLSAVTSNDVAKFTQYTADREEILQLMNLIMAKLLDHPSELITLLKMDLQRVVEKIAPINDKIDQQANQLLANLKHELAKTYQNRTKLAKFHSQHSHRP